MAYTLQEVLNDEDSALRLYFDDIADSTPLSREKEVALSTLIHQGELESDPEAQAISTAIIAMAQQLGLGVVAEGVETAAQEQFLREQRCDELQGYRFSPPVDADEIARLLTRGSLDGGPVAKRADVQ